MADEERQRKLAAARKKLDRFRLQRSAGASKPAPSSDFTDGEMRLDELATTAPPSSTVAPLADVEARSSALEGSLDESDSGISSIERLRQISRDLEQSTAPVVSSAALLGRGAHAGEALSSGAVAGMLEDRLRSHAATIEMLLREQSELKLTRQQALEALASERQEVARLGDSMRQSTQANTELTRTNSELQTELREQTRLNGQMANENKTLRRQVQNTESRVDELDQHRQQLLSANKAHSETIDQLRAQLVERPHPSDKKDTDTDSADASAAAALATAEVERLQRQVAQLEHSVEQLAAERHELDSQLRAERERYRLVCEERDTAHLTLRAAQQKAEQLQEEAHSAESARHSSLQASLSAAEERISLLSEQLAQAQEQSAVDAVKESVLAEQEDTRNDTEMQQRVAALEAERSDLAQRLSAQTHANDELLVEKHTHEANARSLQRQLETLKESGQDTQRLLEKSRGDAELISKATLQNRELKARLEELEMRFVQVTNDKVEAVTQMQAAQHEVAQLRRATPAAGALVQSDADAKEAVGGEAVVVAHALEAGAVSAGEELAEAADGIDAVRMALRQSVAETEQLSQERDFLANRVRVFELAMADREGAKKMGGREEEEGARASDDSASSVLATESEAKAAEEGSEGTSSSAVDDASVREENRLLRLRLRESQLRLSDAEQARDEMAGRVRKEELLATQLAGEADTIGEYIALYHRERKALRERFREKDLEISALLETRSHIERQLTELKRVIRHLLSQRDTLLTKVADTKFSSAPHNNSHPQHHSNNSSGTDTDEHIPTAHIQQLLDSQLQDEPIVLEHCACVHCHGPLLRV